MFVIWVVRQDPDRACAPAGPAATRTAMALPVMGADSVWSSKESVIEAPSAASMLVSTYMSLPAFFAVTTTVFASGTCTAIVS